MAGTHRADERGRTPRSSRMPNGSTGLNGDARAGYCSVMANPALPADPDSAQKLNADTGDDLADAARDLFPELAGGRVDVVHHAAAIVMRALNEGTPEQQRAVLAHYGEHRVAEIARRPADRLSNPAYRTWAERFDLPARDPAVAYVQDLWRR